MVLVLGPKDVKGLITIKEAVDAMEQGFLELVKKMTGWPNCANAFIRRRAYA